MDGQSGDKSTIIAYINESHWLLPTSVGDQWKINSAQSFQSLSWLYQLAIDCIG